MDWFWATFGGGHFRRRSVNVFVSCIFISDEGQHPEPTVGCLSKSVSLPGCKYLDVLYNTVFGTWLHVDHVIWDF